MAAPNFQTSVTYSADGRTAAWHVPFPYARPADVGVKVINQEGLETVLALGTDYTLMGDKVLCFVPAGKSIAIWLTVSVEDVVASLSAGFPAQSGAPLPPPAGGLHSPALGRLVHEVEELKRLQEEGLAIQRARETDAQIQALTAKGEEERSSIASSAASARASALTAVQTAAQHYSDVLDAKGRTLESDAALLQKQAACVEQKARKTIEFLDEQSRDLAVRESSAKGYAERAERAAGTAEQKARQASSCAAEACSCASAASSSSAEARAAAVKSCQNRADVQGWHAEVQGWRAEAVDAAGAAAASAESAANDAQAAQDAAQAASASAEAAGESAQAAQASASSAGTDAGRAEDAARDAEAARDYAAGVRDDALGAVAAVAVENIGPAVEQAAIEAAADAARDAAEAATDAVVDERMEEHMAANAHLARQLFRLADRVTKVQLSLVAGAHVNIEGVSYPAYERALSSYQEQLVRNADALASLSLWAVQQGYEPPAETQTNP